MEVGIVRLLVHLDVALLRVAILRQKVVRRNTSGRIVANLWWMTYIMTLNSKPYARKETINARMRAIVITRDTNINLKGQCLLIARTKVAGMYWKNLYRVFRGKYLSADQWKYIHKYKRRRNLEKARIGQSRTVKKVTDKIVGAISLSKNKKRRSWADDFQIDRKTNYVWRNKGT